MLIASGGTDAKPQATVPQGMCDVVTTKPQMLTPVAEPDMPQPIKAPPILPQNPTDRAAKAQPIAAALPALFALAMNAERSKREDDPMASLTPTGAALTPATTALSIAPTGDAQRQTLDLGRQDWPQKMIDHIEALRDNANANDTSIRLKPEALGRVDIALRTHDNGAVSVRFTAEQPTTRTLLVRCRAATRRRRRSARHSPVGHQRRSERAGRPARPAAS